jgi:large subunit ribosomal protein L14|uniref:Ribosomal protein L14 n=1 Tax=Phaeodactylum tricornutum TaxID=2850 RepID=F1DGP1_PHATR|nr:ribosomal protein L14 [Phaeodactylum tricornutum]ADY18519.1 ribosomal protein L14 [Phaeodactylum tricornutum]QII42424.1 ribosomal protein L14 [Phaeodactylum tricornutum]
MIQERTILKVTDNSGAKTVRCIKVLNGFKRKHAIVGDIVVVSIQQLRNKAKNTSKVRKKEICKGLIVRTRMKLKKKNGFSIVFQENSIVLVNKQGNPIGTRIVGPLPKLLKKNKFQKFISLSAGLVQH